MGLTFKQVVARWDPENARKQVISEAPVFYPNEEVIFFYYLNIENLSLL